MGQVMSYGLTQTDVEELRTHSGGKFSQQEIEALYKRFRSLDRGRKGYISAEEFMNIPELSINPLSHRLERMCESINFKEFVGLLAAFSRNASREDKLKAIFAVYDIDGDGIVTADDLGLMLRHLAGSSLGEENITMIVQRAFEEGGVTGKGFAFDDFAHALQGSPVQLQVDIPSDW
ncbi:hypothetical protein WJX74_006100 [Apatococcus lobatus]|uniref:EF-hand domain-containing protein n=1 Tax=Apatococcus lobatus TaxID=904363 RepID=A0AAW1QBJ8_9CHLO